MLSKTLKKQQNSRPFHFQTNNVVTFSLLLLLLCSSISCTGVKPVPVGVKFDSHIYRTGHGDNFNQTWAANDNIYFNCDDGMGWVQQEPATNFNCRVYKITGGPEPFDHRLPVPSKPVLGGHQTVGRGIGSGEQGAEGRNRATPPGARLEK